jgi:integrase
MQHVKKRKKPEEANIFGDEDEKLEIITHDEYKQIIEFLGTHKNSYGDDYRYMILPVQISYYTGLRAGELAGLCWDDIDLPGRRLVVRRSMFKDTGTKNWELKVPKNGKQRVVDFGETLANILTKAKTQQESDRKLYGELYQKHYCQTQSIKGRPHNIVFTDIHTDTGIIGSRVGHGKLLSEAEKGKSLVTLEFVCRKADGEMVTPQTLKNCNKLIQKDLGITWFHMHGLRHTYGSNMIASGANYKDVQLLMGHSDIGITLNTYVHPNEKTRKTAVDLLEKRLG